MSDPVVIKVGGSLLATPAAMQRVGRWLDATRRPGQTRVLVAGGGAAADAIRAIDAANPVSPEAAHWAAIAMMDAHASLLAEWFPDIRLTDALPAGEGDWALACGRVLREEEPHRDGERLAVGWGSTSDAIAARLAELLNARLILLKHTLETVYDSIEAAASVGVVDPQTPRHAAKLGSVELIGLVRPGIEGG